MIALLALAALAAEGLGTEGHRIQATDGGTALGVSDQLVVGKDGGTTVFTIAGRVALGDFQIGAALPFASYRVPDGRDGALGNARLWAHTCLPGSLEQYVGLRLHFGLGTSHAWTWANAGDELWPGAGIDAYWEARLGSDAVRWMLRGSLGVHVAQGYEPFPDQYAKFQVAGGLDARLFGPVGAIAETSVQYWDPSPWEISLLLRADPVPGLRLRAGAVVPVAVWAGWSPVDQPGAREATLRFDITLAP